MQISPADHVTNLKPVKKLVCNDHGCVEKGPVSEEEVLDVSRVRGGVLHHQLVHKLVWGSPYHNVTLSGTLALCLDQPLFCYQHHTSPILLMVPLILLTLKSQIKSGHWLKSISLLGFNNGGSLLKVCFYNNSVKGAFSAQKAPTRLLYQD